MTYCPVDNDVVSARWQPIWRSVFLHLVLFVGICEASDCNVHLFALAVITDVVEPLPLWSSFIGAMTVCVSMQEQYG